MKHIGINDIVSFDTAAGLPYVVRSENLISVYPRELFTSNVAGEEKKL